MDAHVEIARPYSATYGTFPQIRPNFNRFGLEEALREIRWEMRNCLLTANPVFEFASGF